MIFLKPICFKCDHFDINKSICKAFPKAIPEEILTGNNKHKKPLKGQGNELVYTPIKKK